MRVKMTLHKVLIIASLPLLAFSLAGCKSKPVTETSTGTSSASTVASTVKTRFDPCSVLSVAEVTAITTDTVTKTEVNDHDCHYHTAFEEDGTVLTIYPTGGTEQMQDTRTSMKLLGGMGNVAAVQGSVGKDVQGSITAPAGGAPAVGDEAMWEPNDVLAVRKGDIFVQVQPLIAHDPAAHRGMMISDREKRATSQKLAEAVLAKLSH